MELLKGMSAAEVMSMAKSQTPTPAVGLWALVAPDGKTWMADNPLACLRKEIEARVPPNVALARIQLAVADVASGEDGDGSVRDALSELVDKTGELIEHLRLTGRLARCFTLPALDAARKVIDA